MAEITIFLDNSLNSSDANPPGFSQWIGGQEHGDPLGIKVDKTDTNLAFKLIPVDYLQTWYYEYGWISGANSASDPSYRRSTAPSQPNH